jgi:Holliday junction DNA helicase RuvB
MLDVDRIGLDRTDYLLLDTIINKFGGGPVGVETIAAAINEDAGTIEEVYEPYLMKIGFLKRTPRGRIVTEKVYEHLKIGLHGL